MLTVNHLNETVTEESPSASSFKKPISKEEGEKLASATTSTQKKRRGSGDPLKRSSRHQPKSQNKGSATAPESSESSAPSPEATKKIKKVSFARTAKVKKVRSRQHYTEEERDGMWYSPEEYTAIKKRCVQTLRLMMSDPDFQDDLNHTSRGLESRTKDAAKKRKEFKMVSRELVLEEQENQREAGVNSPGRLRKAYLNASTTALLQAREFAQRDENERIHESIEYVTKVLKFEYGWR